MKLETSNEQLILEAAEEEFLSKGYNGAKTTSIAKKAGVTHAMLHYYYRTKENLFQMVFQEKLRIIGSSFEIILDENLPFETMLRSFIEKHFDFITKNSTLVSFVYNEVRGNKENGVLLQNLLFSKINHISGLFEKKIEKEVANGTIKPIKPMELFMDIITLNLSVSLFFSVTGMLNLIQNPSEKGKLLQQRKEQNVEYILNTLRI